MIQTVFTSKQKYEYVRLDVTSDIMAKCHGAVSWRCVMAICHGDISWRYVMALCHSGSNSKFHSPPGGE